MIKNSEIKHSKKLILDEIFDFFEEWKIKEIFQEIVLKHLFSDNNEIFKRFAFIWWTCLRIIYKSWRYSEDLDFSLYDYKNWDIEYIINKLLELESIYESIKIKIKNHNTNVKKYEIVISDLRWFWYEFVQKERTVKIKFEFDINPPSIWNNNLEQIEFNWVKITVHSKKLLKSWKLSAILFRNRLKWRDYFDLDIYLNDERFKNIKFDLDYVKENWKQIFYILQIWIKNFQ